MSAGGVRLLPGSTDPAHPTSTAAATIDASGAATYVFDLHWNLPAVQLPQGTGHLHIGSVTDNFKYVFNEQLVGADGLITVNAAHEYVLGPIALGDVILGHTDCWMSAAASR